MVNNNFRYINIFFFKDIIILHSTLVDIFYIILKKEKLLDDIFFNFSIFSHMLFMVFRDSINVMAIGLNLHFNFSCLLRVQLLMVQLKLQTNNFLIQEPVLKLEFFHFLLFAGNLGLQKIIALIKFDNHLYLSVQHLLHLILFFFHFRDCFL